MSPVINQYTFFLSLYVSFVHLTLIEYPVCADTMAGIGIVVNSLHNLHSFMSLVSIRQLVFLDLRISRPDAGTWNVVLPKTKGPVGIFPRSLFPFANCNTNSVFICERGSLIYLAWINLLILMMSLISKNKVQKT